MRVRLRVFYSASSTRRHRHYPLRKPSVSTVPTLPKSLRSAVSTTLVALSLATGAASVSAQSSSVQVPFALGITLAQKQPYNFTGRVFDLGDAVGFGSGTLIRRHTVLTAGHVVYDPTAGFTTATTFTRDLYETYSLQKQQTIQVATLSGYQSAVDTLGNTSSTAFQLDQGYLLLGSAPVDEDFATISSNPALLTSTANPTFVLGYPGETFDGRTMAYIVPGSPYVPVGNSSTTGSYENDAYAAEEGMSGGPVYVVVNDSSSSRYVAADTVGGIPDTTGEFNAAFVRVIDTTSQKFLSDAEYTSGLIKKVKVTGPATVQRGTTVTYTAMPIFLIPNADGSRATTDRYPEIRLKSSTPKIIGQPNITVLKTSNTTFDVTFPAGLPSNTTTTLQVFYDAAATPLGKSSILVTIK